MCFTGKERDAETGLDYFGARYMSAAQGRFTSPDVPLVDQHAEDPQSWNLYGYVRNNPLRFIDPLGRECVDGVSSGHDDASLNGQACFTATGTADVPLNSNARSVLSDVYATTGSLTQVSTWTTITGASILAGTGVATVMTLAPAATPATLGLASTAVSAGASPQVQRAIASADVTFTHFTNASGVQGITGLNPSSLVPGQAATVNSLQFGVGQNSYLASTAGDIFVTSLPANASSLQLAQIGVYGAQQAYAISFSGAAAAAQNVIPRGAGGGIYTIPANSVLTGCFTVLCRQ